MFRGFNVSWRRFSIALPHDLGKLLDLGLYFVGFRVVFGLIGDCLKKSEHRLVIRYNLRFIALFCTLGSVIGLFIRCFLDAKVSLEAAVSTKVSIADGKRSCSGFWF